MRKYFFAAALFLTACGSSPEKAIVNRWKTVDVKGNGHDRFLLMQARAKEKGEDVQSRDLEFTKDGKFNAYNEEGVLQGQGTYTMAPDGKSLLLQHPNSSQTVSVKILDLGKSKLTITADEMFGRDTVMMEPR